MAIRLNNEHRHYLYGVAKSTVTCPDEEKREADAFKKAWDVMVKVITTKFLPDDMKVLLKYEAAGFHSEPNIVLSAGGFEMFSFLGRYQFNSTAELNAYCRENNVPLAPKNRHAPLPLNDAQTKIVSEYLLAKEAAQKALDAKMRDYKALIDASTTLEQLEEAWPDGALMLRRRIDKSLPVVLSDEVIARIKGDVRKKVDSVEVSENFIRRPPRKIRTATVYEDEQFESQD